MYKLIIFDLNGTLTNTPFIDKRPLALLPGRKMVCHALQEAGILIAIASNQGGVAFGYLSEAEADQEVNSVAMAIGTLYYEVSYGHPTPKAGYERYASPEYLALRKPAPGMLLSLMRALDVREGETLMVGDLPEDQKAAAHAACAFKWANEFFKEEESDETSPF